MTHRNCYLLAFGSNADTLSSSENHVRGALARCNAALGPLRRVSGLFRTPAFPAGAGPDFVNACAEIESALAPAGVLAAVHRIEAEMGRVRLQRWGQRIIDVDLLAADQTVLPDAQGVRAWIDLPPERQRRDAPDTLILPHPRLQDRGFVLVPLSQIAPDWCHPLLGITVATMLDRLDPAERAEIRPL